MLAIADGCNACLGAHFRNARRVDDDIDERVGEDQVVIVSNGNLARFDGAGHCGFGRGFARVFFVAIGGADGLESVGQAAGGKGADLNALHPCHLCNDIRAHFACADKADADRFAGFRPRCEIARQPDQCHICCHETLRKRQNRTSTIILSRAC